MLDQNGLTFFGIWCRGFGEKGAFLCLKYLFQFLYLQLNRPVVYDYVQMDNALGLAVRTAEKVRREWQPEQKHGQHE